LQIGLSACFFIGPFLYFFVRSAVKLIDTLPKSWLWTLVLLAAATLVVGVSLPYSAYPVIWNTYIAPAIYGQWAIFLAASGFTIRNIIQKYFSRSQPLKPAESWLFLIVAGNVVIFIFYFSSLINAPFASYISGSITFSLILYLMVTLLFYRKKTDELFLLLPDKTTVRKFTESDTELWLMKLNKVMTEKSAYKNPDLKLHELSREIQISGHQLSALLNEHLGKNFTTYVNEFRIAEACKLMTTNPNFTLEAIGYEVGFNSKSTFFAAFKKIKGVTPSSYQQATNQSITL
uniref:helix-turn-helix domain-containing protein n=1 Tax=Spirosoma sp. TaxID=1899569 RepID=UPI003B3AF5F4